MKFRRVALSICFAAVTIAPAACTMPDQHRPSVRNSYPPIVQTDTGGTPMLQDNSSGLENATQGVKQKK